MAKGKSTWKYNKLLTGRRNYFDNGGNPLLAANANPNNAQIIPGLGTSVPLTKSLSAGLSGIIRDNPIAQGLVGMGIQAANSLIGSAIGGGYSSEVGDALNTAGLEVLGGITNRMFGSKMNDENIAKVESNINKLNNFRSNASDFDTLSQNWANAATGMTFDDSFIGKDGWFSNKAKNKAANLREQIATGNTWVQNSLNNNADNIGMTQMQNLLSNYAALGGSLSTHGANFDTKLNIINNGGTHEENPNEGVQMGVDPQGIPNLVEEGEVIFNDYVFSNRLKVPKSGRTKFKLRGRKPLTFAEAAKQLGKESEERPNDPISQLGLENSMAKLAAEQEIIRAKKEKQPIIAEQPTDQSTKQPMKQMNQPIEQIGEFAKGGNLNKNKTAPTWMRYVPAFASGIMAITDALGITNKPDYKDADAILEASKQLGNFTPVTFNPIGNYLTYNPFDRDYYINKLNTQSGATRRNLMNISGGSRGQAMASLLAADYNAQDKMGELFRSSEEYNRNQQKAVEEFNRSTNITNSKGLLEANLANMEAQANARQSYLKGVLSANELRQKERLASTSSRSANLSNFINSIGDIGRENFARNMITTDPSKYYVINSQGKISYNNNSNGLSPGMPLLVVNGADIVGSATNENNGTKARGGYLTIKKRKYGKL